MLYKAELEKMRKVLRKYDIRLQQNLKQEQHIPEDTEYDVIILDYYGMIELNAKKIKYRHIKNIFERTFSNGLLNKKEFTRILRSEYGLQGTN